MSTHFLKISEKLEIFAISDVLKDELIDVKYY